MKKVYSFGVLLVLVSVLLVGCFGGGTKTYNISGVVLDNEGNGLAQVELALEGPEIKASVVVTKADGSWKAVNLKGAVTVTPAKEGWFFKPAYQKVEKANDSVDFTAEEGKDLVIRVNGGGKVLREILDVVPQGEGRYETHTRIKLEAVADMDWEFYHWEGDLPEDVDVTENPIIIALDQSREITAVFGQKASLFGTIQAKHNFGDMVVSGQAGQGNIRKIGPFIDGEEEPFISDEMIVRFDPSVPFAEQIKSLEDAGYTVIDSIRAQDLHAHLVKINQDGLQAMEMEILGIKGVQSLESNVPREISAVKIPSDPHYRLQWHYPQIRLPQAWAVTTGNKGIRIAVIDTGIDPTHPDLVRNLDLVNAINFTDEGEAREVDDLHGHGTHVAGTIGALTSNGIGVAGVMWDVEILPIKIFDKSGRTSGWYVVQGILYAAGLLEEPFNPLPVDVMNLSLGGPPSELEADAVKRADAAGTIVVASAGNDERPVVSYPAAHPEAIAVGAVGNGYGDLPPLASYSNYGDLIDVVAPGGGGTSADMSDWIVSTFPGGYAGMSGTSMACPHVAGVVGLMLANGIPKHEVKDILLSTSMDIGDSYYFGNGLINAYWAVNAVTEMRIILGSRKGNTVDVVKEIAIPPKGGQFIMDILPGDHQFIAWVDVNGNGIIDAGDYYGETPVLEIEPGDGWSWVGKVEEIDESGSIKKPEASGVVAIN